MFIFCNFNLYQIVKNYGIWKISSFYCCIRLVVSLALPLLLLPFTCGTHMVFLQWNVSQCVQIWIFNISNTDLFTQTIYPWYKYYSNYAFLFPFSIHISVSHSWAATCSAVPIGQSNAELHVNVCYLRENVVYTKSKMCFVKNTDAPVGHKIQKSGSQFFFR